MPIPKTRHYLALGNGEWCHGILTALSKVRPEVEAARIVPGEMGYKKTVQQLHHLARRYGFKVCCRGTRRGHVMVWVRKPGIDKNILKLWE